jgi:CRISPR-associated protein Cas2
MDSWLVAYDICDPKRLRKVAQTCEDFGFRRQYSVFLCRLSATDYVRLKFGLYDHIHLEEDQVLFIPLCNRCAAGIEWGQAGGEIRRAGCGDCDVNHEICHFRRDVLGCN